MPVEKLPFSKANVLFGDKQLPTGGIVVVVVVLVKFLLIMVVVKEEVVDAIVGIVVMCLLAPMCTYQSRKIIRRKMPITK